MSSHASVLEPVFALVEKPQPPAAAVEVVVLKFGSSILRSQAHAPAVASEVYGHVRAGR